MIINEAELNTVNQKLDDLVKEMHSLESQVEENKVKIDKISGVRKMKLQVRTTYQDKQTAIELIKRRIESTIAQIEEIKRILSAMDDKKGQVTSKLTSLHSQQMKAMAELSNIVKACVEHTESEAVFTAKINFIKKIRAYCK